MVYVCECSITRTINFSLPRNECRKKPSQCLQLGVRQMLQSIGSAGLFSSSSKRCSTQYRVAVDQGGSTRIVVHPLQFRHVKHRLELRFPRCDRSSASKFVMNALFGDFSHSGASNPCQSELKHDRCHAINLVTFHPLTVALRSFHESNSRSLHRNRSPDNLVRRAIE